MLAILGIAFFTAIAKLTSWKAAIVILGTSVVVTLWFLTSIYLLNGGSWE